MKTFDVYFVDGGVVTRHAEDKLTLVAELHDEYPNRAVEKIIEVDSEN